MRGGRGDTSGLREQSAASVLQSTGILPTGGVEGLAVIGAQFGDEGKGKIVDYLANRADFIVRFNGGNNAGHTVTIGNKEFKLHLLPSGIFHQRKRNLIASGVVLNLKVLLQEIAALRKNNVHVSPKNLGIDYRAHLVMPWHILQDSSSESQKIGTTQRGIGPCYEDKAARTGIRFEDLYDLAHLAAKLKQQYEHKIRMLDKSGVYLPPDFTFAGIVTEFVAYSKFFREYGCDVSQEVHNAFGRNKPILYEGAQGTFLDNNFGTYPFVTSSNCTSASAALNTGVPPNFVTKSEGVVKAYATRVGNGPLATEISGELAEKIRMKGKEFGTTTGRARRIGWLDLPMLRTACRINGFSGLHLTKLDVLAGLKEIKICTHYQMKNNKLLEFPANSLLLEKCKPVYKAFKGFPEQNWKEVAAKGKKAKLNALPKNALSYAKFIEKELKVPLVSVSVGPEREEIIFLR